MDSTKPDRPFLLVNNGLSPLHHGWHNLYYNIESY